MTSATNVCFKNVIVVLSVIDFNKQKFEFGDKNSGCKNEVISFPLFKVYCQLRSIQRQQHESDEYNHSTQLHFFSFSFQFHPRLSLDCFLFVCLGFFFCWSGLVSIQLIPHCP